MPVGRSPTAAALVVAAVASAGALAGLPARATDGARTTADEPYYLLTAASLAEDGDLDIADDLAAEGYVPFHEIPVDPQTTPLDAGGRRLSPHDPLLPAVLAPAYAAGTAVAGPGGGWVAAKSLLALIAGLTAAATLLLAVRGVGVRTGTAALVVGGLFLGVPLAPYGTQVYPELPAALLVVAGVALALRAGRPAGVVGGTDRAAGGAPSGRVGRLREAADRGATARRPAGVSWVGRRADAVVPVGTVLVLTALPWLSVKYVPVAAALAGVVAVRLWRAGRRRAVVAVGAALVLSGLAYLVAHQLVYGGWTVYAAGDHFVETGELSVVGVDPDHLGRTRRVVGLLVDRAFGIGTWAPGWLLLPAAVGALVGGRHRARWVLLAPLAAGWATASVVALTMHGWWVPGRQVVVVLPLAAVAVAALVDRAPRLRLPVAVALVAGASSWLVLAVEAATGRRTLVVDFHLTAAPAYRAVAALAPDGLEGGVLHDAWLAAWGLALAASAVAAGRWAAASRRGAAEPGHPRDPFLEHVRGRARSAPFRRHVRQGGAAAGAGAADPSGAHVRGTARSAPLPRHVRDEAPTVVRSPSSGAVR
jgi:hypothetical protein